MPGVPAGAGGRQGPGLAGRMVLGLTLAGVTLAGVALPGCGLFGSSRRAGVVGDSITLQVVDELRAVAPDWQLDIRPLPGATVGEMLGAVGAVVREDPDQVIIDLGTNNVLRAVPLEQSSAEVERMFGLLDGVPCVHVTTVHDRIFSWEEGYLTDRSTAFNEVLVDAAQRHGAAVIDWNQVLTWAESLPEAPEYLTDTVHLTPDGIRLLALTDARALETGCP